ncbi:MAG: rRNA maturation RNase YbeY [Verrucomicrobiales bacterium]|nr:rRNA maturation RNase YbeY [Verrucomicrobiales bacterium]
MPGSALPRIEIFPHTDCTGLSIEHLVEQVIQSLPWCIASCGHEPALLGGLDEVEISLVTDEVIARVHGEFMNDPTPTDVITFHHGEILVSVDTARREAAFHGNSLAEETLLYIIHGLLHLNGHIDVKEPDRSTMHREQEAILKRIIGGPTEVRRSNQ